MGGWQIAGQRPIVDHAGAQHRGVLAAAVHVDAARPVAGGQHGLPRVVAAGQIRRALEVGLVQPAGGENRLDAGDVHRVAVMRRAGQRHLFRRQREAGAEHGHGLHRLER